MLYDELSVIEKAVLGEGYFQRLAESHAEVTDNLNQSIRLRDYQKEALGRYFFYLNEYRNRVKPVHLLFNMATGSGKTVIMAAAMIDLYRRGYRNFIFFTRLGNIVEKTKLNFLDELSNKYMFRAPLVIDGKLIRVREVKNFEQASPDDVNILLTTTTDLHFKLHNPYENSISFEDFESREVVLIADEAHNLSADTTGRISPEELSESRSWEQTVMRLLNLNQERNVLLEFTATARLETRNPEIVAKYEKVAIHRYDLKQFRRDGYSKDVLTLEIDAPMMERVIAALIVSQYRMKVAEHHGLAIKPVVLFKANRVTIPTSQRKASNRDETVVVSKLFKAEFHQTIQSLKAEQIGMFASASNQMLGRAFNFFKRNGISNSQIARELKREFSEDKCLSVDDDESLLAKQSLLNSLEDSTNRIRAVFATEKLNEGWDVLNLFDIVRLYNSRDAARNRAGKTTVQEAQLIGRGARYFPFRLDSYLDAARRKFDNDVDNDLRVLETLIYHSRTNSRYIQELRSVLTESGVVDERSVERRIYVKDSARCTDLWRHGYLYLNSLVEVEEVHKSADDGASIAFDCSRPDNHFKLSTRAIREMHVFTDESQEPEDSEVETRFFTTSQFGLNILRTALWDIPSGDFTQLRLRFPGLQSLEEFLTEEKYLGGVRVAVRGTRKQLDSLNSDEKRQVVRFVLGKLFGESTPETRSVRGSTRFERVSLGETFGTSKTLKLDESSERARIVPDLNLDSETWFAQNEIWGTSEEKDFVRFIRSTVEQLRKRFEEVLLFRNEMHFRLFDFQSGEAFYPDFVLFLTDESDSGYQTLQVFVEPKGDLFLDRDGTFENSSESWKQQFLLSISAEHRLLAEDGKYQLIGLPFYNSGNTSKTPAERFVREFELLRIRGKR
jgi:type III restriction enzyme